MSLFNSFGMCFIINLLVTVEGTVKIKPFDREGGRGDACMGKQLFEMMPQLNLTT